MTAQGFNNWKSKATPDTLRRGQHLMNTAPNHIANFATGDMLLDCFHARETNAPTVLNFIEFAMLCWDTTDHDEMMVARQLVKESSSQRRPR